MRLSVGLSWAWLLISARTIASEAYIYLSDASDVPSTQTLSPDATRLLLARRLGLSRYHSLEGADEPTIKTLNDFGGRQKTLLLSDERWLDPQRNLIIMGDIENSAEFLDPRLFKATFMMANVPDSTQTLHLVNDLYEQAKDMSSQGGDPCNSKLGNRNFFSGGFLPTLGGRTGACSFGESPVGVLSLAQHLREYSSTRPSGTAILHLSLSKYADDKDLPQAMKDISQVLSDLLRPNSQAKGRESTIIIMPPSDAKVKRTSTSSYGTYAMPSSQRLQARKGQSEAPLAVPPASQTSLASHHLSTPQTLKASSVPRPGILPVCQPNLDKLVDVTNNCSGHGTPYLKGKGEPDCYACRCSQTVLSRGEGKGVKTIVWAGPACSKKDVSAPFWLLAGISIAIVATVSWGIGLLFSIGQEDLPSVIGAGVAGPRAQK
ncbi:MAG: hypothetical protein Q9209_006422 [Squamulea sp. 1 TL-2023]